MTDTRTSQSLLHPWMTVYPGEAYCLCCPWHVGPGYGDAVAAALLHHGEAAGHPTAAVAIDAAPAGPLNGSESLQQASR